MLLQYSGLESLGPTWVDKVGNTQLTDDGCASLSVTQSTPKTTNYLVYSILLVRCPPCFFRFCPSFQHTSWGRVRAPSRVYCVYETGVPAFRSDRHIPAADRKQAQAGTTGRAGNTAQNNTVDWVAEGETPHLESPHLVSSSNLLENGAQIVCTAFTTPQSGAVIRPRFRFTFVLRFVPERRHFHPGQYIA